MMSSLTGDQDLTTRFLLQLLAQQQAANCRFHRCFHAQSHEHWRILDSCPADYRTLITGRSLPSVLGWDVFSPCILFHSRSSSLLPVFG
ncbi:hypothetical protein PENTCL1PPCAC_1756, partial [Pristionchus entomophagus]